MCKWQDIFDETYHCRVPAEEGSAFCIFHEPGEKDVDQFKKSFYEQIKEVGAKDKRNGKYDFTGYVFPAGIGTASVTVRWRTHVGLTLPSRIDQDVSFTSAKVKGSVCLSCAKIKSVSFADAVIEGRSYFEDVTFEGDVDFSCATFKKDILFSGCVFRGETFFHGCQARTIQLHKPITMQRNRALTAQQFWIFARRTSEAQGWGLNADWAFSNERIWRMRGLIARQERRLGRWLAKLGYLLELLVIRIPIAYGNSLLRLFATWGIVTLGFAGLYFCLALFGFRLFDRASPGLEYPFTFGRALYFSIITFTTLGYGDIRPAPGLGSALTATEAVLGGIMMALTVLVIGRKFMR